jgi:hypothetical protein
MRTSLKNMALFCVGCLLLLAGGTISLKAQERALEARYAAASSDISSDSIRTFEQQLSPRSLLLYLGAQVQNTELDCSHFVQYLYQQAGLYYDYAPSRELFKGVAEFKHILHPKPGDLIVWRGHVGIVVDPVERKFLSALNSGVKTSSYESNYWKKRGQYRFLRYVGPINSSARNRLSQQTISSSRVGRSAFNAE